MSDSDTTTRYRVNGHEFEVINTRGVSTLVECTECLFREVISDDEDPEDYLDLMAPECHIEWLRKPEDDGAHGIALRNARYFRGRELIGVRAGGDTGNGEVADSVRIYDDDLAHLQSLLDTSEWTRREGGRR